MQRCISRFGVIWTGTLGDDRYQVKRPHALTGDVRPNHEGHYVFEKRTPDGVLRSRLIRTRQEQKEFCRAEGLTDPADMPSNSEVSADGRELQWKGMPGAWI